MLGNYKPYSQTSFFSSFLCVHNFQLFLWAIPHGIFVMGLKRRTSWVWYWPTTTYYREVVLFQLGIKYCKVMHIPHLDEIYKCIYIWLRGLPDTATFECYMHWEAYMEYCASLRTYLLGDFSQIVEGNVEITKIKVWKIILWRVSTTNVLLKAVLSIFFII